LMDYVNWYNKKRIHGSLKYLSPVDYRLALSI
jgi:putative transposase